MSSAEQIGAVLSQRCLDWWPPTRPTDLNVQQYSTEDGAGEGGEEAGRSWGRIFSLSPAGDQRIP